MVKAKLNFSMMDKNMKAIFTKMKYTVRGYINGKMEMYIMVV